MTFEFFSDERVAALVLQSYGQSFLEAQQTVVNELLKLYADVPLPETAREIRRAVLHVVVKTPTLLKEWGLLAFFAEHIEPEDFTDFTWLDAKQVIALCNLLVSAPHANEGLRDQLGEQAQAILRQALYQFRERKEQSKVRSLLQAFPPWFVQGDTAIFQLHRRYSDEQARQRHQLLLGFLLLVMFTVLVVVPPVLVVVENAALRNEMATFGASALTGEAPRLLTYKDGLYWSLFTFSSVDYTAAETQTNASSVLAALLGFMRLFAGLVIASPVLSWVTPRKLN